ncbi:MAG: YaaA family protein, partial [Desulfopila sp.]|nr:YaaA family protein [Desulfopila sp.]
MLILLSPSKTQKTGGDYPDFSVPEHLEKTENLVNTLKNCTTAELGDVMQISEKLAEATQKRYAHFLFPPQRGYCGQALLTFRGDVFSEIDVDHYQKEDFLFAQKHLRILSGLYGILRPLDLIQPYRLEMGGKFRTPEGETLYMYWRETIEKSIITHLETINAREIINLASNEYFKSIRADAIKVPIINVFFRQHKNGNLRTIAIHAKKARGALTNYIIKNRIQNSSALTDFHFQGYVYAKDLSN